MSSLAQLADLLDDNHLLEQVTAFYSWLKSNLEKECVGSEFIDAALESGTTITHAGRPIRHENAESLSFSDESFDLVVSNDVLEHVNNPAAALAETGRVLKSGGEFFFSVPFYANLPEGRCRAALSEDGIEHFLPEEYHGNPMSSKGSLVFNDFGWDLLETMRNSGFGQVQIRIYWSADYGYLGDPQYYFHAVRN